MIDRNRIDTGGQTGGRCLRLAALGSAMVNVLLFDGSPDETVSGRAYRQGILSGNRCWQRACIAIDRLFCWQPNHCRKSHHQDLLFARTIVGFHEPAQ